jgi:hypothetical protein
MKSKTSVRSISNWWTTSIGFAAATRTFLTVAILSIAASLYWSTGAAAEIGVFANSPPTTVLTTPITGETITVTTLNDVSDFSGARQVSDLPGPDGRVSFREACTAANNTAGGQTIAFAIPVAEFWLLSDVALLKSEQGAFFLVDSDTTVDFTTQTTNIGNTNPTGLEVMIYNLAPNWMGIPAIFVKGNNCLIKGLGTAYQSGYGVSLKGSNNRVIGSDKASVIIEGNLGEPIPTGNVVGGTGPGEGNNFTGVRIGGPADNNIVIGNTIIGVNGVDVIGSTQYGIPARNNRIGGPTPAERNIISGAGRFGEEGYPFGEQVSIVDADGTIVEGNYIGTTVDGMARYPQQIGTIGVEVRDSRNTTIRGNLIAGFRTVGVNHYNGQIFGWAVFVGATNASTYDTVIEGNTIGLASDGVTPIVTRQGITVSPMSGNYHAFRTRIASNHVARVETTGVMVGNPENGVTISGNSIHDSGLLGIDLYKGIFAGSGGVTPNDPGDVDIGGNGLQNFPVLQSAVTTGSALMVQGTLDSSLADQFKVEFFASPSCDPSGFGEGATFLGSTLVTTDGAGHASFAQTLPAAVAVGAKATATTTRLSTGDTSEFSACLAVISGGITPLSRTAFDFDGDNKTDIGIFRPAGGEWWINRSSTGVTFALQFGASTDRIAPADYTGDGKADITVWRPSTGEWYVLRSEDNSFFAVPFGANGDIPVPADYDADGKAGFAVFRPSSGTWFIIQSSGAPTRIFQFGVTGDQPVVADYDGDGRADVGIFRAAAGGAEWWIQRTTAGLVAMQFGTGTDKPVPGDYTGDGKTDTAIWRPSTGEWFIVRSEDLSFYAFPFGTSEDVPAPGDYDGDAKTDATVFRPSQATWYINRTTAGTQIVRFGADGDKPLPSAFLP